MALPVQDHYLNVVPTQGCALLPTRLGDVIGEARGVEGLQVHRSHRVALDRAAAPRQMDDATALTSSEGPVSRSRRAAIQSVGPLPRGVSPPARAAAARRAGR